MKRLTELAHDWAVRCFGREHVSDLRVRSLRNVEEAIELAQAVRVDKQKLHDLIDIVYSSPVGDTKQEIGGVLLTTAVLCESLGYDLEQVMFDELRRVLSKTPAHFADRNKQKMGLGLT